MLFKDINKIVVEYRTHLTNSNRGCSLRTPQVILKAESIRPSGEREPCLPRVPLGQGRSTSMPLWVWGHIMSLFSVASQKRSDKGKVSRGGGEVVCGITGGGRGAPLLPSLGPVVVVVLATPQCAVVVVVVVVVFWGWGDVVTSDSGGAVKRQRVQRQSHLESHDGVQSSEENRIHRIWYLSLWKHYAVLAVWGQFVSVAPRGCMMWNIASISLGRYSHHDLLVGRCPHVPQSLNLYPVTSINIFFFLRVQQCHAYKSKDPVV